MDTYEKLIELQKELLQAQLKVIQSYQQKSPEQPKKIKRTSKLDIVKDLLSTSKEPLHISKIIRLARDEYNVTLERDSVVSALAKKIKAGDRFVRVAPNTFTIKR